MFMKKGLTALALAAALVATGCTTKPAEDPNQGQQQQGTTITPGSVRDFEVNVGNTVLFDFDSFALTPSARTTLDKQAAWLQQYPQVTFTVEGHADERGTREYNLALGARRANSVRDYLVSKGIAASRITTTSYGKERPACLESNEACWAENRRGVTALASGAAS